MFACVKTSICDVSNKDICIKDYNPSHRIINKVAVQGIFNFYSLLILGDYKNKSMLLWKQVYHIFMSNSELYNIIYTF